MSATISVSQSVPVYKSVDVFVAGGGPAGMAAAITARRQGRSVFLAEAQSCFGGMGTAGLVCVQMCFGDGEHFWGGFGQEIFEALYARNATPDPLSDHIRHQWLHTFRPEGLKTIYDDLMVDAGVDFTFNTTVTSILSQNGHITHCICWGKGGFFAVEAKVFVDCTGDADLAAWAGAPYLKGDEKGQMMPGTLCTQWSGIDWQVAFPGESNKAQELLPQAIQDGVFTTPDYHLPGIFRNGPEHGFGNLVHEFGVDGTDPHSVTRALLHGRKYQAEYETFYKTYTRGFEKMILVATGSMLGIRETRRILGDYTLCLEDFKNRAVFADEIGRYAYSVDLHAATADEDAFKMMWRDFTEFKYGKGDSYGIPYRALLPQHVDNLLVAGRCISTDRCMLASVRVMTGCYITGQAAGMAAAIAAEQGLTTRQVPIAKLQQKLGEAGVYLPHAVIS